MPVCGTGDWGGDSRTSGVDGLPNILHIDSTSDFFDQNWSQALSSQIFVHAKEIDFSTLDKATIHLHTNRNTADKSKEASLFASTNSNDPTRLTTWWK